MRPHHTDELDELKAHSNNHRVLEVTDRTHNFIVASEEGLDQTRFVSGGPDSTCNKKDTTQETGSFLLTYI